LFARGGVVLPVVIAIGVASYVGYVPPHGMKGPWPGRCDPARQLTHACEARKLNDRFFKRRSPQWVDLSRCWSVRLRYLAPPVASIFHPRRDAFVLSAEHSLESLILFLADRLHFAIDRRDTNQLRRFVLDGGYFGNRHPFPRKNSQPLERSGTRSEPGATAKYFALRARASRFSVSEFRSSLV